MGYKAVRGQSPDHAVKDWLRFLHGTGRECAELYIHMIIREVSDELGVCTAALFGGLIGIMNSIRQRAEEIVRKELIEV